MPSPGAFDDLFELGKLRFPTQNLACLPRVADELRRIAGATRGILDRYVAACHFSAVSMTCFTEYPLPLPRLINSDCLPGAKMIERQKMSAR